MCRMANRNLTINCLPARLNRLLIENELVDNGDAGKVSAKHTRNQLEMHLLFSIVRVESITRVIGKNASHMANETAIKVEKQTK